VTAPPPPPRRIDGPLSLARSVVGIARLLGRVFRRAAFAVLAVLGPFQVAATVVLEERAGALDAFTIDGPAPDPQALASALLWTGTAVIVGLVLGVVVAGALVALVDAENAFRRMTVADALRIGMARSGSTLGASVLVLVLAFVMLVLAGAFVVPVAAFAPGLGTALLMVVLVAVGLTSVALSYLVIPVAVLTDRGPFATVRRTLGLARGRARRLLAVVVAVALVLTIFAVVVSVVLLGVGNTLAPPPGRSRRRARSHSPSSRPR
jgi:hypothetical protein